MGRPPADAFWIDEDPIRKSILKGYFGERTAPLEPEPLMAQLRDLLSGAPGGETDPSCYYFEIDPDYSVPAFLRGIERIAPGLAALIVDPLLVPAEEVAAGSRTEIASNLGVLVSSLAGSISVKADVNEATAGALLGGFLIVLSRLGPRRTRELVRRSLEPPE
jgi:hypothetical protein